MNDANSVTCQRITEEMASVLDGSAPPEVLAHVAGCDACRDARHDAERAELLMSEAGRDFQLPPDLTQRLLAATAPAAPAAPLTSPAHASTPASRSRLSLPASPSPSPSRSALVAVAKRWAIPVLAAAAAAAFLAGRAIHQRR